MARFALKEKGERSPITTNLAGGKAYAQDAKHELVNMVLTNLVKDQFYRSADDTLVRLRELLDEVDPKFAAKLAIYARHEMFVRSISHVLAAEVTFRVAGPPTQAKEPSWIPFFIEKVVARADDISEIASYYMVTYGAMPTRLKKGLALALQNLDGYSLAKYNSNNRLLNVLRLVHPRPTEALTQLTRGTLPAPETWEVKLSQAGQSENVEEAKTEAWGELVTSRKIGYMALLRNLRNIAQDAPEVLDEALARITFPLEVHRGKQFPVRYLNAGYEIANSDLTDPIKRKIINKLEDAIAVAVDNVPELEGNTVIFVDNSGSMHSYGNIGKATNAEIAAIFAGAMAKKNNADIIVFSSDAEYVLYNPGDTIFNIASQILGYSEPSATYLGAAISAMTARYDRIIIFSDMQTWVETTHRRASHVQLLDEYEKKFDVKPYIYSIDLAGYGSTNWEQGRVVQIAGLNEKIFDLMEMVEQDREALIHEIERVQI